MVTTRLTVCQLPTFEGNEAHMLEIFRSNCLLLATVFPPLTNKFNFNEVVRLLNINISCCNKFRNNRYLDIYIAFWISFLDIVVQAISPDSYKYKTKEEFMEKYIDFTNLCDEETDNLFKTANWMNILFLKVKPNRIKGAAIEIIPKIVEGFSTRYITGSGASFATRRRVKIFEVESNVKPVRRSKLKRQVEYNVTEDDELDDETIVLETVSSESMTLSYGLTAYSNIQSSMSDDSVQTSYFTVAVEANTSFDTDNAMEVDTVDGYNTGIHVETAIEANAEVNDNTIVDINSIADTIVNPIVDEETINNFENNEISEDNQNNDNSFSSDSLINNPDDGIGLFRYSDMIEDMILK